MKTPMQELIEWTDKLISVLPEDAIGTRNQLIIVREKAESMLEKEEEVIMDAYDTGLFDGSMDDVDDRLYKYYYNETFNTKER